MRSSNPVFSNLTKTVSKENRSPYPRQNFGGYGEANPYGNPAAGAPGQPARNAGTRALTVDDIVMKTGIILGIIVVGAAIVYFLGMQNPGLASLFFLIGGIGGFITVLVASFGKKYDSAPVAIVYAVFESLFVGGLTFFFAGVTVKGSDAGTMIGEAVLGTVGVFAGMLYVYKSGAIKVTTKFRRGMTAAMVGVLVLALGNIGLYMFTGNNPLTDGGPLAIVFSIVCIVLAALSFLTDFDSADRMVRAGVSADYAWGIALGLAVTLVWLYTEILRLLSYANRN